MPEMIVKVTVRDANVLCCAAGVALKRYVSGARSPMALIAILTKQVFK
jgi:hypothetical protein